MSSVKQGGTLFTSECVTVGHPDKVADSISDAILDAILEQDDKARVAVETMVSENKVNLAGEVTTKAVVDYETIARSVIKEIGYDTPGMGFDADTVVVETNIHKQSPDIALGVNRDGAGDQGMMFGGAWAETTDFMPLPISIARAMSLQLTQAFWDWREGKSNIELYPDGKTQVTVKYGRGRMPLCVDTVVVSIAHGEKVKKRALEDYIKRNVIAPVLKQYDFDIEDVDNIYINPTGKFVQHGPAADVGLTGRKIIVDTYGGFAPHGGGAFSGKDPSKVDRSGAYMARYIAKNIVAAGLAEKCEVQLAYAIGLAKPVSVNLTMFGTNTYPVGLIAKAVYEAFDMTPKGIQESLGLRTGEVQYEKLSTYGHFGEQGFDLPWEKTDKADQLEEYCKENFTGR